MRNWAVHALPPAVLSRFMEYWTLMVVLVALDTAKEMREKQTQLMKLRNELQISQLNALKKQLQPHFLFNTLNTVSALMDENINDARTVLSRLGQLLRVTLDKERRNEVTLGREIDYIRNYLGIESIRFRDRLRVEYDVNESCENAFVPSMVLQPLVENAVKHGPDAVSDRVTVVVAARCTPEKKLVLTVTDDGKGCDRVDEVVRNGGIGLRNVRERLRLMYNGDADMQISSPGGKGFIVTLTLPYQLHPGHSRERSTAP